MSCTTYEPLWHYQFKELLFAANPNYVDPTKGDVDVSEFFNATLGTTIKAAYDTLNTTDKDFIAFLFNKIMVQERMESYMSVGFETAPADLLTDPEMQRWVKLLFQRLLRVASKYSVFMAKALDKALSVSRERESSVNATGEGNSNTKTAVTPDNGNPTPPTNFQDWGINDNTSESEQTEEASETEETESKYNYEILVDIISKKHDIIEYAEAQLATLWEYQE